MKKPEMQESKNNTEELVLKDGANIAVIGGGPAGSFFTYFALDFANRFGIDVNVDIIEAKDFTCTGPPGCNHCGGIVSESLVQSLSAEGIILPSNVIRRGIESYTLHVEQGKTVIETPLQEQRIVSMFRGHGPLGSTNSKQLSFDNHLLGLCKNKGANIISGRTVEASYQDDGVLVKLKDGSEKKYDLIVGATGLNKQTLKIFENLNPAFIPPQTTKTYISEFFLGEDLINEYFGDSMHVFLLNLPNIKFGALIPKGQYVTLVLLGSNIDKEIVSAFINSKAVKRCFPESVNLDDIMPCQCYPSINIQAAKFAWGDRVVLIGDSSSSKLYKNGIGAAYITAKAAASTAIFEGVSKKDFQKHYQPVCNDLNKDNLLGRFIFNVTTIVQKSPILKKAMLSMVIDEQRKDSQKRMLSSILWDTFTGSASYSNIFSRTLHPMVGINFIKHTVMSTFNGKKHQ